MSGNNFKTEYKAMMESITPSDELLEYICAESRSIKNEVRYDTVKRKKHFRYKALSAAAAGVLIVAACTVAGAVILPHLDMYKSSGDKCEAMDLTSSVFFEKNEALTYFSSDAAFSKAQEDKMPSSTVVNETVKNAYYTDDMLISLAKKASNGSLSLKDLGEGSALKETASALFASYRFERNGKIYILTAKFEKNTEGAEVSGLYITDDISDTDGSKDNQEAFGINLMKSIEFLNDYFKERFWEIFGE